MIQAYKNFSLYFFLYEVKRRRVTKMPNNLKIINNAQELKLIWKCKIHQQNKKYKNKNGSIQINTTYKATFPQELIEAIKIKDNTIYFYQDHNKIRITPTQPENIESKKIKIQKQYHHFSIPTQYFKVNKEDILILTLDLQNTDPHSKHRGILTAEQICEPE